MTATDAVGTLLTLSPAQQLFDLTPGRQIEVGAKQSFASGRGEWTVAGYQIVKKKLLVPDPNNPTLQQQIGQQSSKGIELSTALEVGAGRRADVRGPATRPRTFPSGWERGGCRGSCRSASWGRAASATWAAGFSTTRTR